MSLSLLSLRFFIKFEDLIKFDILSKVNCFILSGVAVDERIVLDEFDKKLKAVDLDALVKFDRCETKVGVDVVDEG